MKVTFQDRQSMTNEFWGYFIKIPLNHEVILKNLITQEISNSRT